MKDTPIDQKEVTATERAWPPAQGKWTYEDWLKLPDDGYRSEVIDGVLYMSPPPLIRHQRISIWLVGLFQDLLKLRPVGEVLCAPIGIRLPNQQVPFQPDIVFVRAERLHIKRCCCVHRAMPCSVKSCSPTSCAIRGFPPMR